MHATSRGERSARGVRRDKALRRRHEQGLLDPPCGLYMCVILRNNTAQQVHRSSQDAWMNLCIALTTPAQSDCAQSVPSSPARRRLRAASSCCVSVGKAAKCRPDGGRCLRRIGHLLPQTDDLSKGWGKAATRCAFGKRGQWSPAPATQRHCRWRLGGIVTIT